MNLITIKKNAEFQRVYETRKSAANKHMVVYARRNGLEYNRFGFSVSKKVGKAVVRNKIRRRLKEILRTSLMTFVGFDVVVVIRPAAADCGYAELRDGLFRLLQRQTGKHVSKPFKKQDTNPVTQPDLNQ